MSDDNSTQPEKTYGETEIEQRLTEGLPLWYYADGHLCRRYRTGGWKATLMVVNAVGHLAEAAWHHPDIHASYADVVVKLMNHAAKGITEKDFELAAKIEAVVNWRPGTDSSLEGTPADPRYRYIRYD